MKNSNTEHSLLNILFKDQYLVAVEKPAGMLVHKSLIDKRETVFLMQSLRDQIGQHVFPLHRLDKPTAGIVLFALSANVASSMGEVIEQRMIHKTYISVVRGYVDESMIIDYPLRERLDKKTDKRARRDKPAQSAKTLLVPLAKTEVPIPVGRYSQARFSLVRLIPETGRKHQLRRHMAHIRHPILGDTTHGDGKQNQFARAHLDLNKLALNAIQIQFFHPFKNQVINVKSGTSPHMTKLLDLFDVGFERLYSPSVNEFN